MNFYTQKKKNHLPAVILKFLTTTPNLTWNFKTHNNVGDNFWAIYKLAYTCFVYSQSIKKFEVHFWYSIHPSHPIHTIPSHPIRKIHHIVTNKLRRILKRLSQRILLFTCTNQLDIKSLQCPFGIQRRFTQWGAKRRV